MSIQRGAGRLTRQERKIDIVVHMLYQAVDESEVFTPKYMGVYEIARRIGLKPTAYLRSMLFELCTEGCIYITTAECPNGLFKYQYRLLEEARWKEPYKTRIDDMTSWW